MKLSNVREAACIRASTLLNGANPKKGFKAIQPEIQSMSDIFGLEFDKHIYKSLFDEIDFKDLKALLANKSSNKLLYFVQELPLLLDRPDFLNIFSQILLQTTNPAGATEIFEGLTKLTRLSYESQFKILLAFFFSMKWPEEVRGIFLSKCLEFHKEQKAEALTHSTVQSLMLIIHSNEHLKEDSFLTGVFMNYLNSIESHTVTNTLGDIENLLCHSEEPVEVEKVLHDLGPLMVNHSIPVAHSELVDCKLDEGRLAAFIIFLLKHQTWVEDKENRYLNKVFLKTLNCEAALNIDESTEKKINVNWNLDAFFKLFKLGNMDPVLFFSYFDDPNFSIKDKKTFEFFLNVMSKLKISNVQSLLYSLIFRPWVNEANQIEFLNFLIHQPDCLGFKNYPGRKVKKTFELGVAQSKASVNHLIDAWSTVDLVETLLKLAKGNFYLKIKEMFEWPLSNIPEVLIINLAMIKAEGDWFLYEELIGEALGLFLGTHVNSLAVLEEVWTWNKELVIKTICSMYRSNPDMMNLSKILDLTQKLKESLVPIVSCVDHNFTVNLAILAVKRDFLHIDQWLSERIAKVGDEFIEALLSYIKVNVINQCKDVTSQSIKENILEKCQLSLESLAIIFENLTPNKIGKNPRVSKRVEAEITNTYKAIFEIFDELQVQPPNSEEIEEAANKLYQSLFHSEMTVEEVIERMKNFKNSPNQKESEIYACMIHSLLDEYRFFHQYPEKELSIIATLFGQIINHKLLDGIIETIALKYVLEGVKKGSGNMYSFACTALEQFCEKLGATPPYLQSLVATPGLKNHPALYEKVNEVYLNCAKKKEGGYNKEYKEFIVFDPEDKRNTLNVKMPEFNKDKFNSAYFSVVNNPGNKKDSFNELGYTPGAFRGMAGGYDDFERENIQPEEMVGGIIYNNANNMQSNNNQSNTLGNTNIREFNSNNSNTTFKTRLIKPTTTSYSQSSMAQILGENESPVGAPPQEIIDKVNFIFNSMSKNNIAEKSTDLKTLLNSENVIRWFSNFFIVNRVSAESNNHPIYHELISFIDSKELNGLMVKDTVNFIKRLLVSENLAKDPKEKRVLTNLGSWLGTFTIAKNKPILAKDLDLKELLFDAYENGKLTPIVAFVCKILEHSAKTKVFHAKNPWILALLSVLAELYYKPNLKTNLKFEIENIFKRLELELASFPQSRQLEVLNVIANSQDFTPKNVHCEIEFEVLDLQKILAKNEVYLNEVSVFFSRVGVNFLNRTEILSLLSTCLFQAINEILAPVVERAVNISQVTTRELILKDFAFEKDESKFRNAANLCIKSLAGSLAMVTCKEPLRIGFNNQMKEALLKKNLDNETIEAFAAKVSNSEVLEVGSSFIQNYVIKRAIDKIDKDKVLIEELEKRRKCKALDVKSDLIGKIKALPEVLRPSPNGLSESQMKIYEDFDRIYDRNSAASTYNAKLGLLKKIIPALKEVVDAQPSTKLINKYEMCMKNIQFIYNTDDTDYTDEDEQIFVLSKLISEAKAVELNLAYELVNVSFKYIVAASKTQNLSLVNIFSEVLKGWVKLHPHLAKDVTNKLLNSEDIYIRFKIDLHYYFFKKGLIDMSDYETFMGDYMNEPSMVSPVRKLLNALIEKNVLSVSSFKTKPSYMVDPAFSGDYFEFFAKKAPTAPANFCIVDYKLYNIKDFNSYVNFRESCKYAVKLMLNMMYQNLDYEQIKAKMKDFLESSIIKNEEQLNVFIMIITELAVKAVLFYDPDNSFYPESEAKCLLCLLNIIPAGNKLKVFENILFGVFKVFHYDSAKHGMSFNQRPYYRLLMSLINLLDKAGENEELFAGSKKQGYFNILADFLRFLSPKHYPGFVLAWIDLLSSRAFSANFLEFDTKLSKEHLPKFEKYLLLFVELLAYLRAFNGQLLNDFCAKTFVDAVYKYVFLLSQSYPEFLCYYCYIIVASLPPGDAFLQLKNIILHSAPADIEQPDPFHDEFKVDSLPDINKNSLVLYEIGGILNNYGYNSIIDEYIETKNEHLMEELYKKLNRKDKEQTYLVINAIVIYWSQSIIKNKAEKKKMSNQDVLDFFLKMIRNLDAENRDHLINSILNELRYPSNQTYYFSCLLLCLFCEIKDEAIEEHILRNILERLLYKPYPWGILVTFVELSRHPKYELNKKSYINKTHCDKMIEQLLKFMKSSKVNKNLDNYVT